MTALGQLNAYLQRLERRLRILAAARGAAIVAAVALILTAVFAWIGNQFAFASSVVLPLRILMYLSVALVIAFVLVRPLLRVNRQWVARRAEQAMPDFHQRLLTLTERNIDNPFAELLAEDAVEVSRRHAPSELAASSILWTMGAVAAVSLAVLLWLIAAAPGYWGYGSSLLWAGAPRATGPLYDIVVHPGNRTIRRRADQLVTGRSDRVFLRQGNAVCEIQGGCAMGAGSDATATCRKRL